MRTLPSLRRINVWLFAGARPMLYVFTPLPSKVMYLIPDRPDTLMLVWLAPPPLKVAVSSPCG